MAERLVVVIAAGAIAACANFPLLPGGAPEHPPVVRQRFPLPPPGDEIVGEIQVVTAREDDTLLDIARHFDVGYNEITAANPDVDPWLPGAGTRVVVPTQFILPPEPWEGIVINVTAMRLYYFPKAFPGEHPVVVTHPIGVGRVDWPTPTGSTSIVEKTVKPSWYVPASIRREHAEAGDPLPAVVPPGPDNPLGDFAMRLSMREYLIHGTNKPYGIGMRVSHGCIRMYPEDIESLFAGVPIGTPVRLVKTPFAVGRRGGALYVAAHAPLEEDLPEGGDGTKAAMAAIVQTAERAKIPVDRAKAMQVVGDANGYPLPVSPGTPPAQAVVANARRVANPFREQDETTTASGWSFLPFTRNVD
ncbi:MAG: L,D-transpeptidase family protein [Gammaproteobacteria bacterium]|nr:L,D-transpeptidase family protein [Gammaproteobacteria bacterium]